MTIKVYNIQGKYNFLNPQYIIYLYVETFSQTSKVKKFKITI